LSRINWRATIGGGYGDELSRHGFVATSAIAMSFDDAGSDMAATLPHHQQAFYGPFFSK